ncbi:MAG: sec-independent translocase [Actinobacteria bacterium]|nr:sec-independent translocase [Actinomycetota bacterium]
MFDIGFGELLVLAVLALFVFGPDKLPKAIADVTRMLKQLRQMAQGAKTEITSALDPELQGLDLSDLNPRTFVERTLNGTADPAVRPAVTLSKGTPAPWDPDTT